MPPKLTRQSSRSSAGDSQGNSNSRKRRTRPPSQTTSQAKRKRTTKPYKVCDVSRTNRKGIMASDLEDLRDKVAAKFNITADFDIVLEDDCTIIEDQDYFATLEANTLLMVLQGNERTQHEDDEVDNAHVEADDVHPRMSPMSSSTDSVNLARIASKLSRNLSALVTLPDDEAQVIAEADRNELHVLLRQPMDIVRDIQHTCAQRLTDRQSVQDAVGLLRLYHRAKSQDKDNEHSGHPTRSKSQR